MPHVPETHIEVEGDKPKVERSRQFFSALRAGLKTSEETSLWLQRELEALIQERDSLAAQLEEAQEKERQLREALRPFAHEPNGVFSVHDDPASCAHCRAWRALDSTQTHGGSDE